MTSATPSTTTAPSDLEALRARLAAREARVELLEEENRWLKTQLFARSTEKTPIEERNPEQAWLFNEAEALAKAAESAPVGVTIPAHERGKGGRKKLSAALPRVDVIHDLAEDQKICASDGTALERIGEEISEQLDYQPAQVRVIRNIRPKYACPCCKIGVAITPVPAQLIITAMRWSLMSTSSAYRISGTALALLVSTAVLAASQVDPNIERVEAGLLPIAAEKIGVPANIRDRMRAYGVPGVSIAVIDHGEIAWAKGYGVADRTTGRPVTPQTLFQAASISKPVSALGALLLVQRGRVNLDEDVNRALKHWRVPESDLTQGHPVTLRTLLKHTARLAQIDPIRVVSVPGKTFEYSAAGYTLLQQLITDVSGKTSSSTCSRMYWNRSA